MTSLIDSVPGSGSRTYLAVILFVLIELGKQFGIVVDQINPDAVNAIQAIIGGLAAIFLRAAK